MSTYALTDMLRQRTIKVQINCGRFPVMKAKFYICTVEASGEKHLPVVTVEDGAVHVNVGSVDHPMIPEHYIEWVYVQTENGGQRKALKPGDAPSVSFCLGDDKAVAVYAYCNLHGLWMTEV